MMMYFILYAPDVLSTMLALNPGSSWVSDSSDISVISGYRGYRDHFWWSCSKKCRWCRWL